MLTVQLGWLLAGLHLEPHALATLTNKSTVSTDIAKLHPVSNFASSMVSSHKPEVHCPIN